MSNNIIGAASDSHTHTHTHTQPTSTDEQEGLDGGWMCVCGRAGIGTEKRQGAIDPVRIVLLGDESGLIAGGVLVAIGSA